jgi:nucleoside-diphosphate-sugar epimerase
MSRAVVTGASGYTGHRLVQFLADQGVEVHAILRPESRSDRLAAMVHIHHASGDWGGLVAEIKPDAIYHLAVPSGGALADELGQWIALSLGLLDGAAKVPGCRFVLAGTWWQFDSHGDVRPCTLYAAAKQAVRDLLTYYATSGPLSACTAVLFDIYGPHDWRRKMVPALIAADAPLPATDGTQIMDLVHVDDVVAGLVAAAAAREEEGAGLYTLGGSQRLSLRQLAGMVGELRGHPVEMLWGEFPFGPAPTIPCPADRPPPGWRARIGIEDGLRRIIAHG